MTKYLQKKITQYKNVSYIEGVPDLSRDILKNFYVSI